MALTFIFGIMGTASAYELIITPPTPTGSPLVYVPDYLFNASEGEDLTGTLFNVSVGIYNITDMKGFDIKYLYYNTTLLDAVRVYATSITEDATKKLPIDGGEFQWDGPPTINDTYTEELGRVWCAFWDFTTFDGSGITFNIEFNITYAPPLVLIESGEPIPPGVSCALDLDLTEVLNSTGDPITHTVVDGSYTYKRYKVVGYPTAVAKVTPSFVYVGEYVTFDGTESDDGGAPPLTYEWDVNSDNTVDATGATKNWLCDTAGTFNVTLTVTNNLTYQSTDIAYWEVGLMLGGIIDLYSEAQREYPKGTTTTFIGEKDDVPCDSYAPGEEVTVFAKVTYNGAPVNNILVAFEALDPDNKTWTYRTGRTNDAGITTVSFRIPVPDEMPWLFGHWEVVATCMLGDVKLMDTMPYSVGWMLDIVDDSLITTYNGVPTSEFFQGDDKVDFEFTVKNIALITKPVYIVVTVYDELGVPVEQWMSYDAAVQAGEFCNPSTTVFELQFATIPLWAFVGKGTVYANLYTELPKDGGVPYCPEESVEITIKQGPR